MAKKKDPVDGAAEVKKTKKSIDDALVKEFGDVFFSADRLTDDDRVVISVSPALDIALGGGILEGSFVSLTGPPKIGKTLTALYMAKRAQEIQHANKKLCPEGRRVFYINAEGRLQKRDIQGISNIDTSEDKFTFIGYTEGNILPSEKYCAIVEKLVNMYPGCVIIIDSFSILSSEGEMAGEIGKQDRGASNKIISQLCRKIAGVIPINENILIGITHQMANTSGYGASIVEKSANALKYAEDFKLIGKKKEALEDGPKQIGQKVEWLVDFSALGPPGGKPTSYLRYGVGMDENWELAQMAIDFGMVSTKGTWHTLDFVPSEGKNEDGEEIRPKCQGVANIRDHLEANPIHAELLRKNILIHYLVSNHDSKRFRW